jgi:hypothetical protein
VTPVVDRSEEIRWGHVPDRCNFIEGFPEGVLEADAGLVPPDGYRSFGIQRLLQLAFHVPTRWSCGICRTTIIEPQPRSGVCVGGDELKDYAALASRRPRFIWKWRRFNSRSGNPGTRPIGKSPHALDLISTAAKQENVDLFHRFALMRHWHEVNDMPFETFVSTDGLHMNDWSYSCIGKALADAITDAVTRPASVTDSLSAGPSAR